MSDRNQEFLIPLERKEGRTILTPGTYKVRIVEAEPKQGEKGPYLKLTLDVVDANNKKTDHRVWDNISFAKKARFKVNQFLDALEMPNEKSSVSYRSLIGKTLWVTLKEETYQGKTKNVVNNYMEPSTIEAIIDNYDSVDFASQEEDDDWETPTIGKREFLPEDEDEESVGNIPDEISGEDDDIPM